jgi:biotin transporter BioY
MLRDREIWMTAFCYWLVLATLIGAFGLKWLTGFSPAILLVTAIAAMPASLAIAIYARRREAKDAQERATQRAEGRFEEAAEWQTDGFYIGWTAYRIAEAGFVALLAIAGVVLFMPVLVLGALALAAQLLWWAYQTNLDHKADIEHRRTSKQRMTAAEEALRNGGWDR